MLSIDIPIADAVVAAAEHDSVLCKICGGSYERSALFAHVGAEILELELHPHGDPECKEYCGFCGANPPCSVTVKRTVKRTRLGAACTAETYKFRQVTCVDAPLSPSHAVMAKVTQNSPCCNAPIHCPSCLARGVEREVFKYSLAAHYRSEHSSEALPEQFKFDDQHLTLLKATASTHAAGTKRRAAKAGLVSTRIGLPKRGRGKPRSATHAGPLRYEASAIAVEEAEADAGASATDAIAVEEAVAGVATDVHVAVEDGGTTSNDDSSSDSETSDIAVSSVAVASVGSSKLDHTGKRRGYSRPIHEFMQLAASFYTVGSSEHTRDVQKMHEHAREGKDVAACSAKGAIVAKLRRAAADFDNVATPAQIDRYRDGLLEVNVEETLLTAVGLRQEADALERRTLEQIKADLIKESQARARRPNLRYSS